MIHITDSINSELVELINLEYKKISSELHLSNKRIHHCNIYHKDWENKTCKDIIENLSKNYKIETKSIISMGFINGEPGCMDQHFHVDYDGSTSTYFIPLCNITNKNGTEYLKFRDEELNKKQFETIRQISDKYIKQESIIEQLEKYGVDKDEYKFEIINGPAYCMVYLPNYVLHRGRSNKESYNKTMFQIVIAAFDGANISSKINFYDSELDEDSNIVEILLKSREINEK